MLKAKKLCKHLSYILLLTFHCSKLLPHSIKNTKQTLFWKYKLTFKGCLLPSTVSHIGHLLEIDSKEVNCTAGVVWQVFMVMNLNQPHMKSTEAECFIRFGWREPTGMHSHIPAHWPTYILWTIYKHFHCSNYKTDIQNVNFKEIKT